MWAHKNDLDKETWGQGKSVSFTISLKAIINIDSVRLLIENDYCK